MFIDENTYELGEGNYYKTEFTKTKIIIGNTNKTFKDLFLCNSMKTTTEKTNTILIIPVRLLVKTNDVRGMIEIKYQALDFLAK